MTDEIERDLFRIKIPLPDSPLKYLNAYVIRGEERSLIVDTGLNRTECLEAMQAGLEALAIDLDRTDIFITHLHADHFGLVPRLANENTTIYFNRPDAELIESFEGFDPMIEYAGRHGFPRAELRAALDNHPGYKHGSRWVPALQLLGADDEIRAGGYTFSCIPTPGHTRGHTCLYEREKRLLMSGDHILIDITPNIQCWSDDDNPLAWYLESLDLVYDLKVDQVLPGHRRLFSDHRARIDELKQHHENRLEEVRDILSKKGAATAFDVAARMTWDIRCDRWEDFPVAQRWFATGEALSHLRYLEETGELARADRDDRVVFSPAVKPA
jgi:glyoxylase-like metal-dependent hydrolase (beta-lactamase superfamily II)